MIQTNNICANIASAICMVMRLHEWYGLQRGALRFSLPRLVICSLKMTLSRYFQLHILYRSTITGQCLSISLTPFLKLVHSNSSFLRPTRSTSSCDWNYSIEYMHSLSSWAIRLSKLACIIWKDISDTRKKVIR